MPKKNPEKSNPEPEELTEREKQEMRTDSLTKREPSPEQVDKVVRIANRKEKENTERARVAQKELDEVAKKLAEAYQEDQDAQKRVSDDYDAKYEEAFSARDEESVDPVNVSAGAEKKTDEKIEPGMAKKTGLFTWDVASQSAKRVGIVFFKTLWLELKMLARLDKAPSFMEAFKQGWKESASKEDKK